MADLKAGQERFGATGPPIPAFPRWLGTCTRAGLLILALLGFGYRIALVQRQPVVRNDAAIRYVPMAWNLLAGRGFSTDQEPPFQPTSHEVPGYPLFLAGLLLISGGSLRFVALVQLVLELATLILTALIASNLLQRRLPGLFAAAMGMGCFFLPSLAVELLPTTLAVFTSTLFAFALSRLVVERHRDSLRAWALAGGLGGISALVRVDTYLFAASVFGLWSLWFALGRWAWRPGLRHAATFGCGFLVVLAPWIVRDWLVFGRIQIPGQVQFGYSHVGQGLKSWMDTWADEGGYLEIYVWPPFERRPAEFPASAVPDADERQRAATLFARVKAEAVYPLSPDVDQGFLELAREAREKRPIGSTLLVGLRRVFGLWIRVPNHTLTPVGARGPLMVIIYGYWIAVLILAGLGSVAVARKNPLGLLLLLGLIGARSAIPFASAWGLASYYLYQGVPAILIFAAQGLVRLTGVESSE